ncbi:MAG: PAS domain S-box protein [Candidatus Krumholzibacteriales bacterium]
MSGKNRAGGKERGSFSKNDFKQVQHSIEKSLEGTRKDIGTLAGEYLSALIRLMGMDSGGIYFFDRYSGDMTLICYSGLSDTFIEDTGYYGAGSRRVDKIMRGAPLFFNSREIDRALSEIQQEEGLRSLAALPVRAGGEIIACINIASHSEDEISDRFKSNYEGIRSGIDRTMERIWNRWNLLRSERKYRAVFDNIFQFTALIAPDGRVIEINRATRDFVDRDVEEVVGNRISESIVWKLTEGLPSRIREAMEKAAEGESVRFESEIQNDRGEVHYVDLTLRPVVNDSGEVELIICEGRDITEHVKLTKALHESEENYRTIFDSVGDAIFIHEISTGRVIDVNDKMIEMYGYSSKDEVIGKTLDQFSSGQYPYCSEFIENKLGQFDSVLPTSLQWHARRKDGSLFWVEVHIKAVKLLGEDRILAVVRDITERKRVEEELRRSEQRYRNIVENSHEAIMIIDDNFKLIFVNSRVIELLGYERNQILGHDFREFLDDESVGIVTDRYRRRRLGEEVPRRYEFNIVNSSGEARRVEISASLIEMDGRELSMALILDITERQRAEKKYRTLFESSKDAIMIMRPGDLKFVEVNPAALELFEIDRREEFCSLTPADISPEVQPGGSGSADMAREMVDIASREGSHFFEWVHQSRNGRELYCTVFLVRIEIGGQEYLQATIRDISKNKEAEKELEGLKDYLRDIFNSMPSVLIGIRENGEVTQWNEEAERVTGFKAEEATGRNLVKLYPALSEKLGLVKEAISSGTPRKDMKVARHINGETRYKDVMVFPVSHRGTLEAIIREDDVTDKVLFEEMIVQSEKMLSLGGFAAGMAHEINNPLAVIIQNASVISNRLTADMPANRETARQLGIDFSALREYMNRREIPEMTETIIDFGKRAAGVVRSMLSFSRKGETERTAVDINDMIGDALKLAGRDMSLDFNSIRLETDYQSGLPKILCEKNKMVQALLNVIKNAAEAMKIEKSRESRLYIGTSMLDGRVCVRVRDNGHGIDDDTIQHVFEPFYTTKREEGMGLGLSIAYFIITESYGGTINVKSREGEWTEFVITVPAE